MRLLLMFLPVTSTGFWTLDRRLDLSPFELALRSMRRFFMVSIQPWAP